jgi:hypothetical protein
MKRTSRVHSRVFVVDRREGRFVVVIGDAGDSIDVEAKLLPKDCRAEGAVIRVDRDAVGTPDWSTATRDRDEEARRREELERRVGKLRSGDAGGDVTL